MTHDASSDTLERSTTPEAVEPAPKLPYSGELLRKALHLLALAIPAGMFELGRGASLAVLVPLAALALGADVLRARSPRVAALVHLVFGRMMRPDERPAAGDPPVVNGASWVLVAAALLALLFPMRLAAPAFGSFMVADAAAAIVGMRFGRRRWPGTERTMEGSAAFVAAAFVCLVPFESLPAAALAACVGAALEVPEWRVNDNVRVPLMMAFVLYLFSL